MRHRIACLDWMLIVLVSVGSASIAQGQRLSPHESARYVVEGATITITYGRPSQRGRTIFGALVPYGRVWMPGADEATVFETSADLQFGTILLPAGSYSLYTLPTEATWKLIINTETGQFHTVYHADRDFTRLDMITERLPQPVERLTIAALPCGAVIGYGLGVLIMTGFNNEVYRLSFVVTPQTVAWSFLVVIVSAFISGLIVRRRLDRLDLVGVLKIRE